MNVLFIVTSSLFLLWVIRELFYWLSLWQENGYRQDRFFSEFKKRSTRTKILKNIFTVGKWIIFLIYFWVIFNDDLLISYEYLIVLLYLAQSFLLLREIYQNRLKKPKITLRATVIIALTLISVLLIFAIPLMDRFFWLLVIDLLMPIIVGFYVLIFAFPIEIFSDWQIEKAGRIIRHHPKLLVIAITGSIGKSLTKDYIAAILSHKFNLIKTANKDNTAIGVARTVLRKVDNETEILVAEFSAYQVGEIKMLCEIFKPKIGVLTAINNHYHNLFKSLDNIKKTNFELVENLPKDGMCLFTGNNKNTLSLYGKSKRNKVLYQMETDGKADSRAIAIIAKNIHGKKKQIHFSVVLNNKDIKFTTMQSVHIEQLLPAIYLAKELGMTDQSIKRAVAALK